MKRHRPHESRDPNAKAAEETRQHFERLYAALYPETESIQPEPEPQPKQGRPRSKAGPAGAYLLLWPTWERICRRLPKLPGGPEFLQLSAEEQREFFKPLARIVSLPANHKDAQRWMDECFARFPNVTFFALMELWEHVKKITKDTKGKTRGPDYWLAALGYLPGTLGHPPGEDPVKMSAAASHGAYDVRKAASRFGPPKNDYSEPPLIPVYIKRPGKRPVKGSVKLVQEKPHRTIVDAALKAELLQKWGKP